MRTAATDLRLGRRIGDRFLDHFEGFLFRLLLFRFREIGWNREIAAAAGASADLPGSSLRHSQDAITVRAPAADFPLWIVRRQNRFQFDFRLPVDVSPG